jgi:hypothetical protein
MSLCRERYGVTVCGFRYRTPARLAARIPNHRQNVEYAIGRLGFDHVGSVWPRARGIEQEVSRVGNPVEPRDWCEHELFKCSTTRTADWDDPPFAALSPTDDDPPLRQIDAATRRPRFGGAKTRVEQQRDPESVAYRILSW